MKKICKKCGEYRNMDYEFEKNGNCIFCMEALGK